MVDREAPFTEFHRIEHAWWNGTRRERSHHVGIQGRENAGFDKYGCLGQGARRLISITGYQLRSAK